MSRPVRTLLFSTLYPSRERPLNGLFVETRLRELLRSGCVETRVVAPVPWFYSTDPRHGAYAAMARTPKHEHRNGIDVLYPRYLVIPKIGMNLAPFLLALGARKAIARVIEEGFDFDVIDAHYYYPDGVAAALLARHFGKRLTITARGSDLTLIPQHGWPRRCMQWAARRADASIGVSAALMQVLASWGIDAHKLHVMRNGVDLQRFRPLPQSAMRTQLGLDGSPILLAVGHLTENKGHHIAIDALAQLSTRCPHARLVIVGDGAQRQPLEKQAERLGVRARVTFAGTIGNAELLRWYSAADVLLLCSLREGWPNVLLESMACGTPVVAAGIWGIPEVVQSRDCGILVHERSGAAFASATAELLASAPGRQKVRAYAEGFSWERTTEDQCRLFSALATRP